MSARVAVVGGTGKTGRAVTAALRAAVPRRSRWAGPPGSTWRARSPGAARRTSSRRTCTPTRRRTSRRWREPRSGRGAPGGAALGRVALRPGDAAPHRQGPGRGRRTPIRARLDDPAAGRLRAELRAGRDDPAALPADAPFGFADLDDVAEVAARVRWTTGTRGRPTSWRPRRGAAGRRRRGGARVDHRGGPTPAGLGRPARGRGWSPRPGLAPRDVRLLRPLRAAGRHAADADAARTLAPFPACPCGHLTCGVQWEGLARTGGRADRGEIHGHDRRPPQHLVHPREPRGPLRAGARHAVHARPAPQGLRTHRHVPRRSRASTSTPSTRSSSRGCRRSPTAKARARVSPRRQGTRARAGTRQGAGVRLGLRRGPVLEVGVVRRRHRPGRPPAGREFELGELLAVRSSGGPPWTRSRAGSTGPRARHRPGRTPTPRTPASRAWSRAG